MVIPANENDSYDIARLHHSTIRAGFLTQLGPSFLDVLYKYLIRNEIVLIERDEAGINGFVSCSINSDTLMKRFIFNPRAIAILMNRLVTDPRLIKPSLETLTLPFKKTILNSSPNDMLLPKTELLSISVDSNRQNSGVGSSLLEALEGELKRHNVHCYKVIAGVTLESANRFYLKHGFMRFGLIRIHGNNVSTIYTKVF